MVDTSDLENGLDRIANRGEAAIQMYLETGALMMTNYAKRNASWTDRSGRARTSLNSHVETKDFGYRIVIAHGVNYGIWLELAHEKKYEILGKTLKNTSGEILQGFNNLMERLK